MTDPAAIAARLTEALNACIIAMDDAHSEMFRQCFSNPIFNQWGDQVNVSSINSLQTVASDARAVLADLEKEPRHG